MRNFTFNNKLNLNLQPAFCNVITEPEKGKSLDKQEQEENTRGRNDKISINTKLFIY